MAGLWVPGENDTQMEKVVSWVLLTGRGCVRERTDLKSPRRESHHSYNRHACQPNDIIPYPGLSLFRERLRNTENRLNTQLRIDLFYILDLLYFGIKKWQICPWLRDTLNRAIFMFERKKLPSLHGTVGFAATLVCLSQVYWMFQFARPVMRN